MRWACKHNSGARAGDSKSQFHPQPGKAEQSSARATQVTINLEFSCLESSGWALILGCISEQKQVPQGLRAAQPGLVCALQCSSPSGLGFDWFLQLSCSSRTSQGSRSTAKSLHPAISSISLVFFEENAESTSLVASNALKCCYCCLGWLVCNINGLP